MKRNLEIIKLRDGTHIPVLGLGTWQAKGKEVEEAIYQAIKLRYRHIDTAKYYGNEVEVGNAVRKAIKDFGLKRSDIYVTTKLWGSDQSDPIAGFEESFRKLNLDYIDLYLIHWPTGKSVEAWRKMQVLLKNGRCKSLGVSNFMINDIKAIMDAGLPLPQVNQIEFSPYLYQKDLLEFCEKKGIVVEAYSPLTRGKKLDDSALNEIAKRYGKSSAQIMLRWCVQHGLVVLPKSTNLGRIKENSEIFDFELSKKDLDVMDKFNEDYSSIMNPKVIRAIMKVGSFLGF